MIIREFGGRVFFRGDTMTRQHSNIITFTYFSFSEISRGRRHIGQFTWPKDNYYRRRYTPGAVHNVLPVMKLCTQA